MSFDWRNVVVAMLILIVTTVGIGILYSCWSAKKALDAEVRWRLGGR